LIKKGGQGIVKLGAKALGLSCGIIWAVSVSFMGLMAPSCPWAMHFVYIVKPFYIGYDGGIVGSLIGAFWGFVDGGIGGFLIAWLYNKLAKT